MAASLVNLDLSVNVKTKGINRFHCHDATYLQLCCVFSFIPHVDILGADILAPTRMHQSFVTTAPYPRGRVGDSRGNEQGFNQSFATTVRGKYRGLLYIGKKASVGENSGVTNKRSLPQGRAFSRDLQDQKSKAPLFPRGGGWLQSDWCITVSP